GPDMFHFASSGSISGNIDGGAGGTNTLDYSALGTATVSVNLQTGKATAIGGTFSNITAASGDDTTGTGSNSTLIGANTANAWSINAANGGSVNGFAFSNFGNLTGGCAAATVHLRSWGPACTEKLPGRGAGD